MAIIDQSQNWDVTCLGMGDPTLFTDARDFAEGVSELFRVAEPRARDRLRPHGISVSQYQALTGVVQADARTVSRLAAYLQVDKSTASRLTTALVDKGWLARVVPAEDGRVLHLVATPEGQALFSTLQAEEVWGFAELLQDIEPDARAEISRLVSELGRCLAAVAETEHARRELPEE